MKIASIERTCYACPSQWEGKTECGKEIYVRYRHGDLSVDLDNKEVLYAYLPGHDYGGGLMDDEEMFKYLKMAGLEF